MPDFRKFKSHKDNKSKDVQTVHVDGVPISTIDMSYQSKPAVTITSELCKYISSRSSRSNND